MKLRNVVAVGGAVISVVGCVSAQNAYPFLDPKLTIEQRADNVVSLLTLEEKIGVLGRGGDLSRLNIPVVGGAEGIHQVRSFLREIPTTSFSQVYGMGETWDPELVRRAGAVEGYEARYISQNEKYKQRLMEWRPPGGATNWANVKAPTNVLSLWGPTSDLARDPRWGRSDESFGEDPFLTGTMVVAFAKGIQGDDPKYWLAASLLKHFFANSNETTRGRSSSDFDERLMREYYSVPFRMGFVDAGVKSYMASYNAWNGTPMSVHPMLRTVVEKEWGAGWIVSSDAGAIELVEMGHKYIHGSKEITAAAIKAGLNQVLAMRGDLGNDVKQALRDGLLTEHDIDDAVNRKIRTTIRLGLLDPPTAVPFSRIGLGDEPEPWTTEKHKAVALQVARESVVLLKNARNALPLDSKKLKSISVVGRLATEVRPDFYTGNISGGIPVLEGIKRHLGTATGVRYARDNANGEAVEAAKASDVVVVVVGNDPMCGAALPWPEFNKDASTKPCVVPGEGREGRDRESIDLPDEELIKQVFAANPNTVVVLISSFPYAINWTQEHVPAIVHITHAAQEQGTAIAEVLFGDYNPGGRLVQTWPRSLAQLPPLMDYDIRHGRTYMYSKEESLYPFGYGLSYTSFKYSKLRLSSTGMSKTGNVTVAVDVTNTGKRTGDEIVQFYVRHTNSKVSRPQKELKGFRRVRLNPGETTTVSLPLRGESLAWWNEKPGRWELEEEPVSVMVGSSAADIRLQGTVNVK